MDKEELTKLTVSKLKDLAKSAGLVGYSTKRKPELVDLIFQQTSKKHSSFIEECLTIPRSDFEDLTDVLEIKTENKTREEICKAMEYELEGDGNRFATKQKPRKNKTIKNANLKECMSKSKLDLIQEAKSMGIKIGNKNKEQLCMELLGLDKDFVEECVASPISCVKQVAQSLDIDTENKTKKQICVQMGNINSDYCMKLKREELVTEAKRLGISIGKKIKKELCDEILKLNPNFGKPTASSSKRKLAPLKLPKNKKVEFQSPVIESQHTFDGPSLLTSEDFEKDEYVQVQDFSSQTDYSNEWLDLVFKLTGSQEPMSMEEIGKKSTIGGLKLVAHERGLNTNGKKKLEILRELYNEMHNNDASVISYEKIPKQRDRTSNHNQIDDIISSNVKDQYVADGLLESIHNTIKNTDISEAVQAIVSETDLSVKDAKTIVGLDLEHTAAKSAVEQAAMMSDISHQVANKVLMKLDSIKSPTKRKSPTKKSPVKHKSRIPLEPTIIVNQYPQPITKQPSPLKKNKSPTDDSFAPMLTRRQRQSEIPVIDRNVSKADQQRIEDLLENIRKPKVKTSDLTAIQTRAMSLVGL